jgi:hypothetical protein
VFCQSFAIPDLKKKVFENLYTINFKISKFQERGNMEDFNEHKMTPSVASKLAISQMAIPKFKI